MQSGIESVVQAKDLQGHLHGEGRGKVSIFVPIWGEKDSSSFGRTVQNSRELLDLSLLTSTNTFPRNDLVHRLAM